MNEEKLSSSPKPAGADGLLFQNFEWKFSGSTLYDVGKAMYCSYDTVVAISWTDCEGGLSTGNIISYHSEFTGLVATLQASNGNDMVPLLGGRYVCRRMNKTPWKFVIDR